MANGSSERSLPIECTLCAGRFLTWDQTGRHGTIIDRIFLGSAQEMLSGFDIMENTYPTSALDDTPHVKGTDYGIHVQ